MTVIELSGATIGYGHVPAVRSIDLTVDAGEVVALLGPNGAGKTTTLLGIAGVLPLIAGEATVLGRRVRSRRPHDLARAGLGFVPEDRGVFHRLTVAENLRLGARQRSPDLTSVLESFPILAPILDRRAGLLSGGEQQMLAVAKALIAQPKVLVIDELSMGLAPVIVEGLLPIIRKIADRGVGVLLVEQHIHAALEIADRGCVLSRGQVVTTGSAAELLRDRGVLEASYLGEMAVAAADREER